MSGCGAYLYCTYCKAHGFYGCSYVYCPFRGPTSEDSEAPTNRHSAPQSKYKPNGDPKHFDLDPTNLPMRKHDEFVTAMDAIVMNDDTLYMKKRSGINAYSIFTCLPSISYPDSFPIDHMHLWFSNVSKQLFYMLRGTYGSKTDAGFVTTSDPYNIKKEAWYEMGNDMDKTNAKGFIPTVFGYNIRSIANHSHEFKAEEWKSFLLRYMPIYLRGRLPQEIYSEFTSFVKAITKCDKVCLTLGEIDEINGRFNRWI
ncbi:hypothetical protein BJ508DRAFT_211035, partial [Ascobolus immersus RN42]